ncbi:MAG TPA: ABC transporter permease subunit [Ktedonobacterales bacterium]
MATQVAPGSRAGKGARRVTRNAAVALGPPAQATGARAYRRVWRGGLARQALAALAPAVAGLALLAVWQFTVKVTGVSAFLVPGPEAVLQSFVAAVTNGMIPHYAVVTIEESLTGFITGALIALPLGYAVARNRALAAALEPYLAASQAVPAVALAPLLVLLLGYGVTPVTALCALIVFFPAAVNTTLGFRTLDHEVLDAARLDGAGWWAMLWDIEAPLALPSILAGLRASLTLSVTGAVVGEFVIGDQGLGGLLTIARGNFDAPLVFATLLALAILAVTLYGVARLVERLIIAHYALEA